MPGLRRWVAGMIGIGAVSALLLPAAGALADPLAPAPTPVCHGQDPYGQPGYGSQVPSPYGPLPYTGQYPYGPYGPSPYGPLPYYGQPPYGQYGPSPYGPLPYAGQPPYGPYPYGPYGPLPYPYGAYPAPAPNPAQPRAGIGVRPHANRHAHVRPRRGAAGARAAGSRQAGGSRHRRNGRR